MDFFFLIVLLIFSFICVIVGLKATRFNIGIPSNIMMIMLTIGYTFYLLGYDLWKNQMLPLTFFVLFCGMALLLACSLIIGKQSTTPNINTRKFFSKKIDITYNIFILTIITSLFFALYCFSVFNIGRASGLSFSQAISYVKKMEGEGMSIIARQGYKVVSMSGYLSSFVLIYSLANKFLKKSRIFLVINIAMACVISVVSGSRGDILKVLASLICFYFLFFSPKNINWKRVFGISILASAVFILSFYLLRFSVKSFSNGPNELPIVDYIIYYIGSPVEVLNIKLKSLGTSVSTKFGYLTFFGFYSLFDNNIRFTDTLEWQFVYIGKYNFGGNVATYYFSFLADFGIIGSFLAPLLIGGVGNGLYLLCSKIKSRFFMILNGWWYAIFVFSFYSGMLVYYTNLTAILSVFVCYCLYLLVFKIRFEKDDYAILNYARR